MMKRVTFFLLVVGFTHIAFGQKTTNDKGKYPPLVTFTAGEDHENMMKQLGIKSLRPGPSGNENDINHANYDESVANPCPELPDVLTLKNGKKVKSADVWWKQRRGELLEDFEQEVYGNPNPDYIMGFTNMFSYKGLSLSFLIDYKKGGDIFSETVVTLLGRGVTKDTEDREKTVILPGVYGDANTKQPVLDANGNKMPNITQVTVNDLYFSSGFSSYAINAFGEWNVYDATTLRLREITLGYDIPKKILGNLPIRGAYLGVSGRNLWYWAMNMPEYTNFDPEISTNGATNVMGVEYSGPPSTRRFGFNLKVIF